MHPNRKVLLVLAVCLLSTGIPHATAQAQQAPASSSPNPELDQLLAPIALYPDSLLAQVLACSSNRAPSRVIRMASQSALPANVAGVAPAAAAVVPDDGKERA